MFKVNDQVVIKKKLQNCTRVQIGSVIEIHGEAFTVSIPGEIRPRTVNASELSEVSSVYPGRKIVDHVAARRGNFKPYRPQ